MFFVSTLEEAPAFTEIAHIVADGHGYAAEDVGVYIQPQHQGVDPSRRVQPALRRLGRRRPREDMKGLADDLAANLIAAGAYFSRPYGAWAQPVYNRDAASRDALRSVKAIFDPAGIMNPGKLCFGAPEGARGPRREGGLRWRSPTTAPTRCAARAAATASGSPSTWCKSHRFAKGCPSVEAGKFHAYSAGGKLITALCLMDGRSEVTDQVVDVAFSCQLCGNCDVTCKLCRYDMEPILALRELRAHLVEMDRVPDSYRPLIERTRAGLAGKGPKTPADRNAWAAGLGLADPAAEPVDVVFYAGCKYSLEESLRETVRTQARLLQQAGLTVGLFENGCCGGLADKMGYRAEAAEAGGRMLAQWAAAGVKTVVTPCADCRHVFTRLYPGLEGGAATARGAAHRRAHRPAGQGGAPRAHHPRAR